MAIIDLFSKRQKRHRGEVPEVYTYDTLPEFLRNQIIHIIEDSFNQSHQSDAYYDMIRKILCKEYGRRSLNGALAKPESDVIHFFSSEKTTERALDVIELCFKIFNSREFQRTIMGVFNPDEPISELNSRFKEAGIGYQFISNEIIRIDSESLHEQAVKPTLLILQDPNFKGANEEFLSAHENYRHGRHKECLVDCLKSLESTLKTICTLRGWSYEPTGTATKLIEICFANGLIPPFLETQMGALRTLLQSGVPTIRNKLGGHGQGPEPVTVPEFTAKFTLNLTASTILFLIDNHKNKFAP